MTDMPTGRTPGNTPEYQDDYDNLAPPNPYEWCTSPATLQRITELEEELRARDLDDEARDAVDAAHDAELDYYRARVERCDREHGGFD